MNLIAALAPPAVFAAKMATTTIPIVFVGGLDPVKAGLVASVNRPGGNVTGVTFIGASLGAKRLELARELVPNVSVIALLTHPNSPDALEELRDLNTAAKAIGQELLVVSATSDRDFEAAFASFVQPLSDFKLVRAYGPWSSADCPLPQSKNWQAPREQLAGDQRPRHSSNH